VRDQWSATASSMLLRLRCAGVDIGLRVDGIAHTIEEDAHLERRDETKRLVQPQRRGVKEVLDRESHRDVPRREYCAHLHRHRYGHRLHSPQSASGASQLMFRQAL
jgi:hypothetical protein